MTTIRKCAKDPLHYLESGNSRQEAYGIYREIRISSIADLLRMSDTLYNHVFRGQADKAWGLETTFYRAAKDVPRGQRTKLEKKIVLEFRRRAHHYLSDLPKEEEYLEWLALMQHHGCPTRLLDFTRSYYVALFFAVENAESDSALWAIDQTWYESPRGTPASEDHLCLTYNKESEAVAKDIVAGSSGQGRGPGVLVVEPYRMNERLSLQQGLFLFPHDLTTSFEENLCSKHEVKSLSQLMAKQGSPVVVKLVIPRNIHLKVAMLLSKMNISAATLFPGLDGYARSQKIHIQSAKFTAEHRERLGRAIARAIAQRWRMKRETE